ncbi:MAG: hypothetical protein EZS28_012823 [Streblomastix strix]|uniref:Ferric oxidoreductase domain-containing protein n=1 Tax=Streblomastix strix TaxID=222440 RepID=A0A5J4W9N6_9EUKA|nr:MAG: hypothetical protein EZS28_012823 [Streblomastix strix]
MIRLHIWMTPAMGVTALLHLFLMALAKHCKGNYGICFKRVFLFHRYGIFDNFARVGILILIISITVSVLRLRFKKIPMIIWRIFHWLFYIAFVFISLHVISYGSRHAGLTRSGRELNIFRVLHFILPLYLLLLVTVAFVFRINQFTLIRHKRNKGRSEYEKIGEEDSTQ